ncbi:flagellar brake protein [Simiduia agarivorans]|uniref:Glycosyltransferase n=1 Tax=Simiduia agarivorans (strain DSM 21679 / JCM 13881 / BCRC 17597 / SA1) TaxID=1117647 RepID=K4KF41_SIMAS|nr:flagellar brake protein [Simiduia agarivorans]AFU97654.1 putative glycosyltransferase [Simiduia agarivorans SA1 = DSM 21679]
MDEQLAESQHLSNPEDILRVLQALLLNRSLLTVAQPGTQALASSMVVAIDDQTGYWLIDALSDETLQHQLRSGQTILIRAAYGGIQVSCEAKVQDQVEWDYLPAVKLTLPQKMLHRQRRAAFRADIAAADRPHIQLESNQRPEPLHGQVFDISADGVGVLFDKFIRPPIEPGELFSCAQLHPALPQQHWQLMAKHPQYDKMNDKYRCGFSLVDMNAADAKRISQWVLAEQRKQRMSRRR